MLVGSSLGNSADRALRTRNLCHRQYSSNSHLFLYSSDHGCSAVMNSIVVVSVLSCATSMGDLYRNRPCNVFTVIGGYWKMFYDEMVGYKLPVPWQLASQMARDTIDKLRRVLCRIREDKSRMKIRLNRYQTKVEIRESVECKLYKHARYVQSLLAAPIYQSDVEMSDEE
ncbi:hypothetical protein SO802_014187 [Lithocarpus litseifolius]|uniref:Uncharacterized protein n=1 Tax=Lithocarpus litseifolius TaxID=425828 RepID=A0AAW2CTR6_9ROSI